MNPNFLIWPLEKRIVATILYFEIFNISFNLEELRRCLIGKTQNAATIRKALESDARIQVKNGRYYIEKCGNCDRNALKEKYWKKIRRWKWIFKYVPFVRFVAVCNYLSFGAVEKDSDIDLFIVTRPGRIFIAKYFATALTQLFGVRRHGKKIRKRFCLSFIVDEGALNMHPLLLKEYDIYFAYWLMALIPIYGSDKVWQKLSDENVWANRYFENFNDRRFRYQKSRGKKDRILKKVLENMLSGGFGDRIEAKLKAYALKRYEKNAASLPKNASVIVSDSVLKYHNNDQREHFKNEFEAKLKRLGLFD